MSSDTGPPNRRSRRIAVLAKRAIAQNVLPSSFAKSCQTFAILAKGQVVPQALRVARSVTLVAIFPALQSEEKERK